MPGFQFKLAQHVTVPVLGVPGRVYKRIDTAGAENTYALVYLNDICGPTLVDHPVSESDLIAAQPKPVDPVDQVVALAKAGKTAQLLPRNEFSARKSRSKKRSAKR